MSFKKQLIGKIKQDLVAARKDVNRHPTEGQIEAGNYALGHIRIKGYDISIENPKGSVRSGIDSNGRKWSIRMNNDYGYFRSTLGYDGDAIDVFIGPDLKSEKIFVIDQIIDDKFDESKVMFGFNTEKEAMKAYKSNYEKGWDKGKYITAVSDEIFREWLYDDCKQRKPFYSYVKIQKEKLNESKYYDEKILISERHHITNNDLYEEAFEIYNLFQEMLNNNREYAQFESPSLEFVLKLHLKEEYGTETYDIFKDMMTVGKNRLLSIPKNEMIQLIFHELGHAMDTNQRKLDQTTADIKRPLFLDADEETYRNLLKNLYRFNYNEMRARCYETYAFIQQHPNVTIQDVYNNRCSDITMMRNFISFINSINENDENSYIIIDAYPDVVPNSQRHMPFERCKTELIDELGKRLRYLKYRVDKIYCDFKQDTLNESKKKQ